MKSLGVKVKVNGMKALVLHASGSGANVNLHIGKSGEPIAVSEFYGSLSCSEARTVRRALRNKGFGHAAQMKPAFVPEQADRGNYTVVRKSVEITGSQPNDVRQKWVA